MEDLIDALQKWLRRNHVENSKCEKHLFTEKGDKEMPYCLFSCKQDHWSVNCIVVAALADRKKFFVDHYLGFNCGRSNHRADLRRRCGCVKCKYRHHTSICYRQERENNSSPNGVSLTGYTNYAEEKVLPAIIPVSIKGQVLWAYLDTGSGRNFISREAVKLLKLKPTGHETRKICQWNQSPVHANLCCPHQIPGRKIMRRS